VSAVTRTRDLFHGARARPAPGPPDSALAPARSSARPRRVARLATATVGGITDTMV
jgi:hypothetical protein